MFWMHASNVWRGMHNHVHVSVNTGKQSNNWNWLMHIFSRIWVLYNFHNFNNNSNITLLRNVIWWSKHSKQTSFGKKTHLHLFIHWKRWNTSLFYMYQLRHLLALQMLLFELWASLSTTKTSRGLNYSTNFNDLSTFSKV